MFVDEKVESVVSCGNASRLYVSCMRLSSGTSPALLILRPLAPGEQRRTEHTSPAYKEGEKGQKRGLNVLIPGIPSSANKDPRQTPLAQCLPIYRRVEMETHNHSSLWVVGNSVECQRVVKHHMTLRLQKRLVPSREVRLLEQDRQRRVCSTQSVLRTSGFGKETSGA